MLIHGAPPLWLVKFFPFSTCPAKGRQSSPSRFSAVVKCLLFSGCLSTLSNPTMFSEMPIFGRFFTWTFRNGSLSTQLHVTMDYTDSKGLVKIYKEIPKLFAWFDSQWKWDGRALARITADAVKIQWSLVTFPYSGVHIHSNTNLNFIVSHSIPNVLGGEHPVFSDQIPVLMKTGLLFTLA